MDFNLSDVQRAWTSKAEALALELAEHAAASDVISGAARAGVIDPQMDLLTAVVAIEALARESAGAAVTLALHTGVMLGVGGDARFAALARGETVGAIALSTDEMPTDEGGRLKGRASWVAPLTDRGLVVVGARGAAGLVACALPLDTSGIAIAPVDTAALGGLVCGHVDFDDVTFFPLGATLPFMTRVRILLAAAGMGIGRRALREALAASRGQRGRGAGGEQTVQGLLADSATELDAAMLLTWKAAASPVLSLAEASMAKLAATEATQRAVGRATQVVGADSFRSGHRVERLAREVRALELFAGRTEALREAVAGDLLPQGATS